MNHSWAFKIRLSNIIKTNNLKKKLEPNRKNKMVTDKSIQKQKKLKQYQKGKAQINLID